MPEPIHLEKAKLLELTADFQPTGNKAHDVTVQFNPETLSVGFSNQVVTSDRAGCQIGPATLQFVGAGATELSVTLWFDVTAPQSDGMAAEADVRKLTEKVVYFITPTKQTVARQTTPQFIPPAVRFVWGSFLFDGIMTSLNESLEFFSSDGLPLRASVTFKLAKQEIHFAFNKEYTPSGGQGPLGTGVGTTPLVQAPAGVPLQQIVDSQSLGMSWQSIAAANGIENPRILKAGLSINLNII